MFCVRNLQSLLPFSVIRETLALATCPPSGSAWVTSPPPVGGVHLLRSKNLEEHTDNPTREALDDAPGSLGFQAVRERRQRMLERHHMTPLVRMVTDQRNRLGGQVPHFDPMDGGVDARLLFLFEKPGPMTDQLGSGSGFISRNNDDPTARATLAFMRTARIPRKDTVIWNLIPWWDGSVRFAAADRRRGLGELSLLMAELRKVQAAVLVGKTAWTAETFFADGLQLPVFKSYHPSRRVQRRYPVLWESIPAKWAEAWAAVCGG